MTSNHPIPSPRDNSELSSLISRGSSIQLLPILLKARNNLLTLSTDSPLRKLIRHLLILRTLPNQNMCRVQQRIARIIGSSLVNSRLILQLCRDGQVRAAVGNGILIQQDRSRERLDRIRDVLVVPG